MLLKRKMFPTKYIIKTSDLNNYYETKEKINKFFSYKKDGTTIPGMNVKKYYKDSLKITVETQCTDLIEIFFKENNITYEIEKPTFCNAV